MNNYEKSTLACAGVTTLSIVVLAAHAALDLVLRVVGLVLKLMMT